jgi:toluene monooxygenase system protein B
VNRSVAARPGHRVRVRRQGHPDLLARDLKLADTGIAPMECLHFVFEREEG